MDHIHVTLAEGRDVEVNLNRYEDDMHDELDRYDLTQEERAGILRDIIPETKRNMEALVAMIQRAIMRAWDQWNGSKVVVHAMAGWDPVMRDRKAVEATTSAEVAFGPKAGSTRSGTPTFTVFQNPLQVEDVLDFGDSDFFRDAKVEADYFTIVNELRNPGASKKVKTITLYTARPKRDRPIYDRSREVPVGIFLTTDPDRAVGIAHDLGAGVPRDIYRVEMLDRFLVKTLDRGRVKDYQVIGSGGSKTAPVVRMERV